MINLDNFLYIYAHGHVKVTSISISCQLAQMDVQKARENYALYTVYKNTLVLLRNREFVVDETTPTYDQFLARFELMHTISRSSMSMVVQHVSGTPKLTTAILFMESPEKKSVSVSSVRDIHQHLIDSALTRCILIHQYALSSGARRELIQDGRRIEAMQEKNLLFNPTHHFSVPKIHVLGDQERETVMSKHHTTSSKALPRLDPNDPVCRYYGVRKGDIVGFERVCETAGTYMSYRVCARHD